MIRGTRNPAVLRTLEMSYLAVLRMMSANGRNDSRWLATAWPAANGLPDYPCDLLPHQWVRYQFPSGRMFRWEFEKQGERLYPDIKGQITVGDQNIALTAALDGLGPAFIFDHVARSASASGPLVRVLRDWCPQFPGPMLITATTPHIVRPARLHGYGA